MTESCENQPLLRQIASSLHHLIRLKRCNGFYTPEKNSTYEKEGMHVQHILFLLSCTDRLIHHSKYVSIFSGHWTQK